jgi:hypothetical protein
MHQTVENGEHDIVTEKHDIVAVYQAVENGDHRVEEM